MKIPSRKRREYWYIGHYTPEGKHWCLLGSTWKREPVLSTVGLRDPRYESQYLPLISQVVSASPFERTHPEAERLLLDMGFPAKFAPEKLRHDMYSESYRQRKAREDAFYEEALKYAVN